jgi:DNA-binding CsgD family transcriptional regulator
VTAEALRALFRMTEAEASLVTALYAGATLSEASRSLGKSLSTLRTQLRSAFDKTSTRRQVDLLRVIDCAVRP